MYNAKKRLFASFCCVMGILNNKALLIPKKCASFDKVYKYSKYPLDFSEKSIIIYNSFLFAFDAYLSAERNEHS